MFVHEVRTLEPRHWSLEAMIQQSGQELRIRTWVWILLCHKVAPLPWSDLLKFSQPEFTWKRRITDGVSVRIKWNNSCKCSTVLVWTTTWVRRLRVIDFPLRMAPYSCWKDVQSGVRLQQLKVSLGHIHFWSLREQEEGVLQMDQRRHLGMWWHW